MEFRPFSPVYPRQAIAEPQPDAGRLMESCVIKAMTSTVMGGGMGVVLGIAMGAFESATPPVELHGQPAPPSRPLRVELRDTFRKTIVKSRNWGKNFGAVTAVFSGVECTIEKMRAKRDLYNGAMAGCTTGAVLAAKAGPQAACLGCAGFAAFSVAIEYMLRPH